jgi:HD-like signal output (HDOD) protein/DNA-binding NarL/FixJ family response regulator
MTKSNNLVPPKILVVDDDQISRDIISFLIEEVGECISVESGINALKMISKAAVNKTPFDLLILDISMPHMNGIELLFKIRKNEYKNKIPKPERIKAIIVTGNMRMSTIKDCIKLGCNGFLSKPFSPDHLYKDIARLGLNIPAKLLKSNTHQDKCSQLVGDVIHRFNKGKIELPILPHMIKKMQDLLKEKKPAIEDLSKIIEKDAVITTELISVVNSSLYHGNEKINNLKDAIVRLGIKETQSIMWALSSKNLFKSKNAGLKQFMNKLWKHALACAIGARLIARHLELENYEEIFLMGIVHDIGKTLLLTVVADISPDQSPDDQNLQEAIGLVHTTFGAVLLEKMNFSKKYALVTELHHWNSFPEDSDTELLIIHLANNMANAIGFDSSFLPEKSPDKKRINIKDLKSFKMLYLDYELVKDICKETKANVNNFIG